ncbi:MATE family efflux transporter [Halarsenatibacter silvermanii]|uniref:Putative efflux protein, MATE family n=1 Tax=Halarsenatibacter silvermanii TaxID=321763 RepID=A0A1G9NHF2_9FIRM|nr:MATE family efflux transporter [Halarsenatibacter silvermanii]SDL85804.1 putative efflux protein, MATE family [Halarsenatibacter silvermanii]
MKTDARSERLGKEPIIPLVLKLSLPGILAMTAQSLYSIIDSIFIGQYSTEAISSLALFFPLEMILIGISVGTGVGATSLISRLLGADDLEDASQAGSQALFLAALASLMLTVVGFFFTPNLVSLFAEDEVLIAKASSYSRIVLTCSYSFFLPIISNHVLRGEGNTFLPMLNIFWGAGINIILDPLMIFGIGFFPEMGLQGAALATVIARSLSGVMIIYLIVGDKIELNISLKHFSLRLDLIREIYRVGFPAMIMQFMASFMLGGMNRILAQFSSEAIAVGGIYFRLQSFVLMPIFGIKQGYLPLIGYNYSHNKPGRVKKGLFSNVLFAFLITTSGMLIFQFAPEKLLRLFSSDPELINIGVTALRNISPAYPIIGPAIIISATFQAIGRGVPSLIQSFFRQMVLLLPLMYFLGSFWGLSYLWYAFPISELGNIIIALPWLYFTLKKELNDPSQNPIQATHASKKTKKAESLE